MNREQGSTYKFLSNDFTNPRWKTAAKKNAFALLGKQRYEYAAAFFLLADALKDCVNVCFTQLKDPQLAIAVARVYEGDDGPVLKGLLKDKVLPLAVAEGNRWMATWAYWMLKRRDLAVRAIVVCVFPNRCYRGFIDVRNGIVTARHAATLEFPAITCCGD